MRIPLTDLIKTSREAHGLTQEELAARAGVSQQSIAKWESGASTPRPNAMLALAAALNLDMKDLMQTARQDRSLKLRYHGAVDSEPVTSQVQIEGSRVTFQRDQTEMDRQEYGREFEGEMQQILEGRTDNPKWSTGIKHASHKWPIGYMTDKLIVNFRHVTNAAQLAAALRKSIPSILWKMATLKAHLADEREYVIIVTMPKGEPVEVDIADRPPAHRITNDQLLTQLTSEAALLGITMLRARSPAHAVEQLDVLTKDENTWAYLPDYDD